MTKSCYFFCLSICVIFAFKCNCSCVSNLTCLCTCCAIRFLSYFCINCFYMFLIVCTCKCCCCCVSVVLTLCPVPCWLTVLMADSLDGFFLSICVILAVKCNFSCVNCLTVSFTCCLCFYRISNCGNYLLNVLATITCKCCNGCITAVITLAPVPCWFAIIMTKSCYFFCLSICVIFAFKCNCSCVSNLTCLCTCCAIRFLSYFCINCFYMFLIVCTCKCCCCCVSVVLTLCPVPCWFTILMAKCR